MALPLSSSTDEIAQALEQTKKSSSVGTTATPRAGDEGGTYDQPKRARSETSPPRAESRQIPKGSPTKRAKTDPNKKPASERGPWLRYLMRRALPGTHTVSYGEQATVPENKGGSRDRLPRLRHLRKRGFSGIQAARCGKEATAIVYKGSGRKGALGLRHLTMRALSGTHDPRYSMQSRGEPGESRRNNYRGDPQDTSRPGRDLLQESQRRSVMNISACPASGIRKPVTENPKTGVHTPEVKSYAGEVPTTTGTSGRVRRELWIQKRYRDHVQVQHCAQGCEK